MSRIYIETSIPSFYYEVRSEPEMVSRRNWTRQWLDAALKRDEVYASLAVVDELEAGDFPGKNKALKLVNTLPMLGIYEKISDIEESYFCHHLMPRNPGGDALHLALASYHNCEFLVTWNCQHLANANKFGHIRHVNGIIGLTVPTIVTPLELLPEVPL